MTPKPHPDSYRDTKVALNQVNKLVIFWLEVAGRQASLNAQANRLVISCPDSIGMVSKKESKAPVLNNCCNPVLSISSKEPNDLPRTPEYEYLNQSLCIKKLMEVTH